MATVGTVGFVQGQVIAIDASGNERLLTIGDEVLDTEQIVTSAGARIEMNMVTGDDIVIENGQSWSPTAETFSAPQDFAATDATLSPEDLALQEALLAGADPTELGEATAAGAGPGAGTFGGTGDGGTSFVRTSRTAGEVDPNAGYETIGTTANLVAPELDPQNIIHELPGITVADADADLTAADNSVVEGSEATVTGDITVTADAGVATLTIGGVDITNASAINVVIAGTEGTLTVTGYNAATGAITYSYKEDGDSELHNATDDNILDQFAVVLVDNAGKTTNDTLDIQILDTEPTAHDADSALSEDTASVTGTVTIDSGADSDDVVTQNNVQGTYGKFSIDAEGVYTYVLDTTLKAVQELNDGDKHTETFEYTVLDADGDESTAEVTITINGKTDGEPEIEIEDMDGNLTPADNSVTEATADTVTGNITVTAEAGVATLTIGGADITNASTSNVVIAGTEGTLTVTGYNAATGAITYSYKEDGDSELHNATDDNILDQFAVVLVDNAGKTTNDTLDIQILDTEPTAHDADSALSEDTASVTGTVTIDSGADSDDVVTQNNVQGTYGKFSIDAEGVYTYVLDTTLKAVQELNDGDKHTETFEYTVLDADGDESTAEVTITINGKTDGEPEIEIEDMDGNLTPADNSVTEATADTVTGNITVTAEAGVATLTIGGADITNASTSNVVIAGTEGTLTVTGYNAATGAITYSYKEDGDSELHNATDDNILDQFAVVLVDNAGKTTNDTLDIQILDTEPTAHDADSALSEDTASVTGTVTIDSGADSDDVVTQNNVQGTYGKFSIDAEGVYTYVLDTTLKAVQELNDGDKHTETFEYTVLDADGDESTAEVTITINGKTDGEPEIEIEDMDGNLTPADNSVTEATADTVTGNITVTAEAGVATLTIGGADITNASTSNVVIAGTEGTLTVTGYNAATGAITYSYKEDGDSELHNATDDNILDQFAVVLVDNAGKTTNDTLDIQILDTEPTAHDADSALSEDTASVTGTVTIDSGADSDDVVTQNNVQGTYGKFSIDAEGVYTYVLDTTLKAVQELNDGDKHTETFEYTVLDADGDESTAEVTITINGKTDGEPEIEIEDMDGNLTPADNSVTEATADTVTGNITVTAEAGVATLTIGGADITNASTSNVVIAGTEGTLTVTGYNAATGAITYSYKEDGDSELHNATDDNILDQFAVVLVDNAGKTTNDTLDIQILDTEPTAHDADSALSEDTASVTGTVTIDSGADSDDVVTQNNVPGTYGKFSIDAEGVYTYVLDTTLKAVQELDDGDKRTETFEYTVIDADGDESTAEVTITINGITDQDTPLIVASTSTTVSEEGLDNANADAIGTPDTTNDIAATGSITFTDQHNSGASSFDISLSAPSQAVSSQGELVTQWTTTNNGQTLTGYTNDGTAVVKVEVGDVVADATTANGFTAQYEVTLLALIDHPDTTKEDTLSLDFGFSVNEASGNSVDGNFQVTIEDDAPIATDSTNVIKVGAINTNLMIILDTSGSMGIKDAKSGGEDVTRLALAKESIAKLIADYDHLGDVMVQLVTFNTNATGESAVWMTADAALALLTDLSAGGNTNYDDALAKAKIAHNSDYAIADAQNVSYFFSDGEPYPAQNGIDDTEVVAWESFVEGADITSYAIGLGANVSPGSLNPVAHDGVLNQDKDADIVDDLADLDDLLSSTVSLPPVIGNLYTDGYGADGGRSLSVTLNEDINGTDTEVIYTYNIAANEITNNINSDVISGSMLNVDNSQASVQINMLDGSYTYQGAGSSTVGNSDQISYTLVDKDGDNATGTVHFDYQEPATVYAKISVDSTNAKEGDTISYTVTLVDKDGNEVTVPAGNSVTVNLVWADEAANASDAAPLPSSVIITGGTNHKTFNVVAVDDYYKEDAEDLTATITSVTDTDASFEAVAVGAGATITTEITDEGTPSTDDTVYAVIESTGPVDEGGMSEFIVSLVDKDGNSVDVTGDVEVTVSFANGSSEDGDFDANSVTVTISSGNSASFSVQTNSDADTLDETFNATIDSVNDSGQFEKVDWQSGVKVGTADEQTPTATAAIIDINDTAKNLNGTASIISEEGLANANPDDQGDTDTTDNVAATGSITFTDQYNGGASSFDISLSAPSQPVSSQGELVTQWVATNNGQTLTGYTSTGTAVVKVEVGDVVEDAATANGFTAEYEVTLLAPVDHPDTTKEDTISLDFGFNVNETAGNSVSGSFQVTIEDDAPVATDSTSVIEVAGLNTNLMIILDTSGSMADNADGTSGQNKQSRLELAKASIIQLAADYAELGDVMVQLVTFSSTAVGKTNVWLPADKALLLLNGLSASGATNYDDALAKAKVAFGTEDAIDDAQNVSYFFSDGEPYPADSGIDGTEVVAWETFLEGADITSYAIGLGSNITSDDLNPIAHDGALNQDKNADIVDDLTDLDDLLSSTVNLPPVTGNLYTDGYGADGGRSLSVTLNEAINGTDTEVVYTYNIAANQITNNINSDVISGSMLSVGSSQASVQINMLDGSYTYQGAGSSSIGDSDQISYTLVDNDGDNASGTVHFNYQEPTDPVAVDDYVLSAGNGLGLRSEYYAYQQGTGPNDDGANLERIDQIKGFIAANDPDATFIAKDINYHQGSGDLGGHNGAGETNLQKFLGDDADSLVVHNSEESRDAIIKMYGLIDLDAGTYKFKVNSDDGYSIVIDGVEVARVDKIQSPTVTPHPEFTLTDSGLHSIEILYWDQQGDYVFEPLLKEIGGSYQTLTSNNFGLFQAYQAQSGSDFSIAIDDILANDSDPQGDALTLTQVSDAQHGSAVINGDQVVFTPAPGYQGQASFSYSISDGNGGTDQATVYLTVEPETILGNTGNDNANLITAGLGNDFMTGNGGADTFLFNYSDSVEKDTVADFKQLEGDKLDLSDMLIGENAANLDDYLNFSKVGDDTLVKVNFEGDITNHNSSVDQKILLKGVDLTNNGANSDSTIIQDLLDNNNLIID